MTRMSVTTLILISVTGCSTAQSVCPSPMDAHDCPKTMCCPKTMRCPKTMCSQIVQRTTPARPHNETQALLEFRRVHCARPKTIRDSLIQQYHEQSTQQAIMRTLMLASCAPDQTPGLLMNTLAQAQNMKPHSHDLAALLDLIAAQTESYTLLERHLKSTQTKLDDMITGIRTIETEMGESDKDLEQHPAQRETRP